MLTGPGVRPGEQPPQLLSIAKTHTDVGALAFGSYFLEALDWSAATNDPFLLLPLVDPKCVACGREIEGLRRLTESGERQVGGRIEGTLVHLVAGKFRFRSDRVVEADVTQSAATITGSDLQVVSSLARQSFKTLIFISWSKSAWVVVEQAAP